jgi:hypothetical protein
VLVGFADGGTELLELDELDEWFANFESAESDASLLLDVCCELSSRSFGFWVAKVRLPARRGRA